MGIKSFIYDTLGSGRGVTVTQDNALLVASVAADPPAPGTPSRKRFFSEYMTLNGVEGGDNLMNKTGGTLASPLLFSIRSRDAYDIHIMGISIMMADSAITHNSFGNVNPLPNGFDLALTENGEETQLITKAKTGGGMLAQAGFSRMYGTGAEANELLNWSGQSDAQTIYMPVGEWLPDGVRIGRATQDKIEAKINDNLSGLTEMWVQIFGFKLYPGTEGS